MTDNLVYAAGDLVMTIAMIGAFIFAVSYATFFNWRRTEAGRALMYFVLALVLWAALSTFTRLVTDYPFREWVRLAVYIAIVVSIGRMIYTLWTSWRRTPQPIEPRPPKE